MGLLLLLLLLLLFLLLPLLLLLLLFLLGYVLCGLRVLALVVCLEKLQARVLVEAAEKAQGLAPVYLTLRAAGRRRCRTDAVPCPSQGLSCQHHTRCNVSWFFCQCRRQQK